MELVNHPPASHSKPVSIAALKLSEIVVRCIGIHSNLFYLCHNPLLPVHWDFIDGLIEGPRSNDRVHGFTVTNSNILRRSMLPIDGHRCLAKSSSHGSPCAMESGKSQARHTCSISSKNADHFTPSTLLPASNNGALHGNLHSLGQSGAAGFGRQPHEPTHRGNLILVLLDAPVKGSAVFLTDQRLRRTHTLGYVRHIEPASVYHIVEMATALFLDTKTVNSLGGITSESL